MSDFLAVLALYYICDSTAALRPMSGEEVLRCTQTYETVKTYFVPSFDLAPRGSLARFEQMQHGYLGFKSWEADNPDIVADLRQKAERAIRVGFEG
ncbi:hypothetical protein [Cognatishimia sp. MH4019]|uniref:hypothetical protein n=1 Tax=Cognatishimia sp. MH4019 TaxID=2854030 RepID=UPI001CD5E44B|nr:hypothetical protein [Cognatishimia sp. MH4019]